MNVSTIRLVSFTAALVGAVAWASTGLASDDPQPKDEALDGLTKALEEAEKAKAPKPAEKPSAEKGSETKGAKPEGTVDPKDQALDNLLEKLGETAETPAPDDKPAGAPKPTDAPAPPKPGKPDPHELKGADKSTDEHLEELTGRRKKKDRDQDGEGSGPLAEVIKEMRDVEQRLGKPDTGEATRKKQAEIVKNLETIIDQLRNSSGGSQGKSIRMVRQAGQKPGSQSGATPGSNGGQAPNTMPRRPTNTHSLAADKAEWGHLPDNLQRELESVFTEAFLTKKVELIEHYYRSLSRKSLQREE